MKTRSEEPAFPQNDCKIDPDTYEVRGDGLTKREYFASLFLQGMLAHSTRYKPHNPGTNWMECISTESKNLADKFIEELNKEIK